MEWIRRFGRRGRGGSRAATLSLWRSALLAILDDDLAAAESALSGIVERDTGEFDAYLALARIHRKRGDVGRAISIHQTLVLRRELTPRQRMSAIVELGADYRAGGFLRRAIASYEEVLDHDRRHPAALAALAELYALDGRFAGALTMLRRRMRVEGKQDDAEEADLLLRWSRAAREEGRADYARKLVRRALRRDPQRADAHRLLGDLEAERGRSTRALAPWNEAIALEPDCAPALYPKLAAAYRELGRGAEFEAWLRERIEGDPDDIAARIAYARQLDASDRPDDAVAAVRRALDRCPGNLEAHAILGRLLLVQGLEVDSAKGYAELIEALDARAATLREEAH